MAIDAVELGDPRRAVVLATGATQLRDSVGGGPSVDLAGLTDPLVLAAERLDEEAFSAAADEGRRLSMEELVAVALAVPDRPT
jgi:hypothetical protein